MRGPLHICLGGPTGAGKTTLAYNLKREAPFLRDALVLDNDQVRRDMLGYDLRKVMQDPDYTPEVTARLRERMDKMTLKAFAEGRDVIDSSGFWSEEAREHIEALAKTCGARFIGIWLDVPEAVLLARIEGRLRERKTLPALSGERGHASDACAGVLRKYACMVPLAAPKGWLSVDGGSLESDVVNRVILLI